MPVFKNISFDLGEGFAPMTAAEIDARGGNSTADSSVAYRNAEEHIVFSLAHRSMGDLAFLTADRRAMCRRLQKDYAKIIPEMQVLEEYDIVVTGKKRTAFVYSYVAEGIAHIGRSVSIVEKNGYTVINVVYRAENSEAGEAALDHMLKSVDTMQLAQPVWIP